MKTYNHPKHGNILITNHVHDLIEKDKRESCPQRTEPWYQKRNNHLTASAMATACGANPYETRMTLLKKKTGHASPFTGNKATEHGNKYEDEAITKYEQMTGEKQIEFGLLESLNENEKFLAGSPDGITASGRLLEVKCPFRRIPTNEVPDHYKYQVQFLMQILNIDVCDFIQYVPETTWKSETFIITTLKRDKYWWQAKLPTITRFWDEVLEVRNMQNNGIIPPQLIENKDNNDDDDNNNGTPVIKEGKTITIKTQSICNIIIKPLIQNTNTIITITEESGEKIEINEWSQIANFFDSVNTK